MKRKINTFIMSFLCLLGFILSFIPLHKFFKYCSKIKTYYSWYYIRRKFKSVGKNSFIEKNFIVLNPKFMILGSNVYANEQFRIEAYDNYQNYYYNPLITIGNNTAFGYRCHIGCINKIEIGENVLFGSNVVVIDHSHGEIKLSELKEIVIKRKLYSKGPVIIGNNVWVGENVAVLANVIIGDNSIIGANSVVTHDIPSNCIAAGNPAKVIKNLANNLHRE